MSDLTTLQDDGNDAMVSDDDLLGELFTNELLNELVQSPADEDLSTKLNQHRLVQQRLVRQLEELAAQHYPVFLQQANANHAVVDRIEKILSANHAHLTRLPDLETAAKDFLSRARSLNDEMKMNSKAMSRHTQMLELLEIPQLMETFIRNGHFDDAITVLLHSRKLISKQLSASSVLRILNTQLNKVGHHLVKQLCNQLRSPLSLPACIKIVMLLRRTGSFTEHELRLKFLQARTTCLEKQLAANLLSPRPIFTNNPASISRASSTGTFQQRGEEAYWRATQRIRVTRGQLFDIVTEYRAVFTDDDRSTRRRGPDTASLLTVHSVNPLHLGDDETGRGGGVGGHSLLQSWLVYQITTFLAGLSADVGQMLRLHRSSGSSPASSGQALVDRWSAMGWSSALDGCAVATTGSGGSADLTNTFTQLQSLITDAVNFGRAFSRIGCDFRPHLVGLFQKAIMTFVESSLAEIVTEWTVALDNLVWKARMVVPAAATDPGAGEKPEEEEEDEAGSDAGTLLVAYPVLVLLHNQLVQLRASLVLCCPVALKQKVLEAFCRCLRSAAVLLVRAYRMHSERHQVDGTPITTWRSDAQQLAVTFARHLVPSLLTGLLQSLSSSPGDRPEPRPQLDTQLLRRLAKVVCQPIAETWPAAKVVVMSSSSYPTAVDLHRKPEVPADSGEDAAVAGDAGDEAIILLNGTREEEIGGGGGANTVLDSVDRDTD